MGSQVAQFNCPNGRCTTKYSDCCSGWFDLFWLILRHRFLPKKKDSWVAMQTRIRLEAECNG